MKAVTIEGYTWQKTVGDEGQDVYVAQFWEDCEHKLGQFMEDTDYNMVISSDADFYAPPTCDVMTQQSCSRDCVSCVDEEHVIFKFRKNKFTEEEQLGAYEGLIAAATETQNRGLAAGPKGAFLNNRDWVTEEQQEILDYFIKNKNSLYADEDAVDKIIAKYASEKQPSSRGMVWLRSKIKETGFEYSNFFDNMLCELRSMPTEESSSLASKIKKEYISDTTYAAPVNSGIAGFFDRYPRIPYGRATSYTEKNPADYEKSFPYMRRLSSEFKRLLPERYSIQENCANKIDQKFRVVGKDTPFTTITVNKNFRTAAHRDAGDLNTGFSNLTVVAKEKDWTGGLLVLPEFRVAIDLRPGDLLLINNHGGIHGNTKLMPPEGKDISQMERMSLVCYFREKMLELGSWDYEQTRRQFVDSRRLNKEHVEWRPLWNGISAGMWTSQEWYSYLEDCDSLDMLAEYHPEAMKENASLEEFFG